MKIKNPISVFAISVACVLMLAGCSNSSEEKISTPTTSQPSAAASPEPSPEATTGPEDISIPTLDSDALEDPTIALFCGITDAEGKVTPEDVILANEIATELRASEDEFLVSEAQNYKIFAEDFQFALDETKGQLLPSEIELISKNCSSIPR